MSLIVKKSETECQSQSTQLTAQAALQARREEVRALVRRYDQELVWDEIQARDVPAEMIDYVTEALERGDSYDMVRRQLGIPRRTDKAWKKIMAALKQGFRIDGQALLQQIAYEYRSMSQKIRDQIDDAFENGVEVLDKDGCRHRLMGPQPQLAGMIDTYNRLNQGFIKNAKDLGAYVEQEGKGKDSGVTIVIQSAVQLPTIKDVKAEQERQREKNQALLAQGRTLDKVDAP